MRAAPRRGAMVLRSLSSSRKYRRLSLPAKAALPLLWAWTDDQGRIAVDAEELKMTALAALVDVAEPQVESLFREYADVGFGVLYEASPGMLAFQWKGWDEAQTMRRKQASDIPAPPGRQDDIRRAVDEPWYQARQQRLQQQQEEQRVATKGEKDTVAARLPAPAIAPEDAIEMHRGRYAPDQLKWIDEAISHIGAPSAAELAKEYEAWARHPAANVAAACQTFAVRLLHKDGHSYPYLRGIIRRWDSKSERPPAPKETGEDRLDGLERVLVPQFYSAPKPEEAEELGRFKRKLVDLAMEYRLQRRQAIELVSALKVEEWWQLEVGEVERRIRTAIVAVQMRSA